MCSPSGRWNNPLVNKELYLSSSTVASCCQLGGGESDWGGQGEDITTMVERMERHKKMFTNNKLECTVSSPSNFWTNSCPSHSSISQKNLPFNPGNSRSREPFLVTGASSASFNNHSTFSSRTPSFQPSFLLKKDRFSMSTNYENDRLMQMD